MKLLTKLTSRKPFELSQRFLFFLRLVRPLTKQYKTNIIFNLSKIMVFAKVQLNFTIKFFQNPCP